MTALAAITETALMRVVFTVAVDAGLHAQAVQARCRRVAGEAIEIPMRTGEGKSRLLVVIEAPDAPTVRIVTGGAVTTETTLVRIVPVVTPPAFGRRVRKYRTQMTLLAGDGRMHAEQRKTREIVIVSNHVSPASLVVALLAARSERAGMHVVGRMTPAAVLWKRIRTLRDMTRLAGQGFVPAAKTKTAVPRMVETNSFPCVRVVTTFTAATVATVMNVVACVTARALGGGLRLIWVRPVTACTTSIAVPTPKRVLRITVVVEGNRAPLGTLVADRAVRSERSSVHVVEGVTAGARRARPPIGRVRVTFEALDAHVRTGKRKLRLCVFKTTAAPRLGLVTRGTRSLECSVMRIVVCMARCTLRRRLPWLLPSGVTIGAGHLQVRTGKLKVRPRMIECGRVESGDVRRSPFVIDVARRTGGPLRGHDVRVEPHSTFDITGDVLVTLQTQPSLSLLVEGRVASLALAFVLRVPFDHLTRHDQVRDPGVSAGHSAVEQDDGTHEKDTIPPTPHRGGTTLSFARPSIPDGADSVCDTVIHVAPLSMCVRQ